MQSSRRHYIAVQLGILLLFLLAAQGQAACTTSATYKSCTPADLAARMLTLGNSQLTISNANWIPGSCPVYDRNSQNNRSPYGNITTFGSCHYHADSMPDGAVVLSTGAANLASALSGSSNVMFNRSNPDSDLQKLAMDAYNNSDLHDTQALQFDITPKQSGPLVFQYVFGSEEYPTYAPGGSAFGNGSFNDVFAFYIWPTNNASDKTNVALLPNSTRPVSIFSVNSCNDTTMEFFNPNYAVPKQQKDCPYVGSEMDPKYPTALNGMTQLLNTALYNVTANVTYTIKLVIADMADDQFDSLVWVKAGSLTFYEAKPVNCSGAFSDWSTVCNATCGAAYYTRNYNIKVRAANNGSDCQYENGYIDAKPCEPLPPCPVNCVGDWTNWSNCNATCGGGNQTRWFNVTTQAAYGGSSCTIVNGTVETRACNPNPCPVDCVGDWAAWGPCNASCGGGNQTRKFVVTRSAAYNGTNCTVQNGTVEVQACNTNPCPVNCVGAWSGWGPCSEPCGGGNQTRTFIVTTPAAHGGTNCPELASGVTETQTCNTQQCPVNCVGAWSDWGACSETCGGGFQTRTFTVTQSAANNGSNCPTANGTVETQGCNTQACPVSAAPSPPLPVAPASSPGPVNATPAPSPSPVTESPVINQTVLDKLPYYVGPTVLPPLPPMEDTNITIRGGNVTITGVKIEAGAAVESTQAASTPMTGSTLLQTNLTLRWAAFNGSLGFYTLGVNIMVYGEFVLQRTMDWTWNSQYSAWTTQVIIKGKFKLTRDVEVNGVVTGSETLEPSVDGDLTLYSAIYPGPGFSGTYDWAGNLDMVPDPFAYWGIHTLTHTARRLTQSSANVNKQCCPYNPSRTLLQTTDTGNTPVQGRVSVREVNNKRSSGAATSNTTLGGRASVDEEITVLMPASGVPESAMPPGNSAGRIPFLQAFKDNPRLILVLAAVVAPSGLALCAAAIVGAVLYRKKRRKDEEQKQEQLQQQALLLQRQQQDQMEGRISADVVAASGVVLGMKVPNRKGRRRKSTQGQQRSKSPARLSNSGTGGDPKSPGLLQIPPDDVTSSPVQALDPMQELASPTGYPKLRQRRRISNTTDSEDGQGATSGYKSGESSRLSSPKGVRSTLRLPSEAGRTPNLPGSQSSPIATPRGAHRLAEPTRQGSLDLSTYSAAQDPDKAAVPIWAAPDVQVNPSEQTQLAPVPVQRPSRPTRDIPKSVPAQWSLPALEAGAQTRNPAWASGVAAAWAADMQAASRGAAPPAAAAADEDMGQGLLGGTGDDTPRGTSLMLPSRLRKFPPTK